MKKILASVAAIATLTGFASSAHAGSGGVQTITGLTPYTSVHTGSVTATCDVEVKDGALPTGQGLINNMISNTKGLISTVCNNAGSNLAVALGTTGTTAPVSGIAGYAETFKLDNANGAYTGTAMTAFGTSYTKTDLSNAYSATASTLDVTAKVGVPSGSNLPSGSYTVNVVATVTP
jgi:hypothetical protein